MPRAPQHRGAGGAAAALPPPPPAPGDGGAGGRADPLRQRQPWMDQSRAAQRQAQPRDGQQRRRLGAVARPGAPASPQRTRGTRRAGRPGGATPVSQSCGRGATPRRRFRGDSDEACAPARLETFLGSAHRSTAGHDRHLEHRKHRGAVVQRTSRSRLRSAASRFLAARRSRSGEARALRRALLLQLLAALGNLVREEHRERVAQQNRDLHPTMVSDEKHSAPRKPHLGRFLARLRRAARRALLLHGKATRHTPAVEAVAAR